MNKVAINNLLRVLVVCGRVKGQVIAALVLPGLSPNSTMFSKLAAKVEDLGSMHRVWILRTGRTWLLSTLSWLCLAHAAWAAPLVLYTDVLSGPNSGGEQNLGMYLTVFGKNFGSGTPGTNIKVYINEVEVARYIGGVTTSRGRSDIQQLAVQIGSLGNPVPGTALPVKVAVDGVASNADNTFTVQPGRIFYLDNVSGNDATGVAGDIGKPFRYVQAGCGATDGVLSANRIAAGDVIVLRGRGSDWSDLGCDRRFARFRNITGTASDGANGHGPITILGYPGETVNLSPPVVPRTGPDANGNYYVNRTDMVYGGIHGMNGQDAYSDWVTIANLRISGGDWTVGDGPIILQTDSNHWRIINNELYGWTAANKTVYWQVDGANPLYQLEAKSGAISGNGKNVRILGNHIHNITGTQHNHCIYIDSFADDIEIAYNHIHDCLGGNIIQTYDNTGMPDGSSRITNIAIHHNALHDGNRYGINIADNTRSASAWNNLVYNTAMAGLRFNVNDSLGTYRFLSNTFYNTNSNDLSASKQAVVDSWCLWCSSVLEIKHNIFVPNTAATGYTSFNRDGSTSWPPAGFQIQRNVWFGLSANAPVEDTGAITGDPRFQNVGNADFRLGTGGSALAQATAATSFAVGNDYSLNTRPSSAADIGALQTVANTSSISVTLGASPASVAYNGSSTLTWSSANATSCSASGAWSGTKAVSGSQSTGALTATTIYQLTCTGTGGSTSQQVTVSVAAAA
jgi:hypothetical protein